MTPEEKKAQDELITNIKTQVETIVADKLKASTEKIEALKSQVAELETKAKEDNNETLKGEVASLQASLKAIQEGGKPAEKAKSIREQLKASLELNADKWKAFKNGETKSFSLDLDLKAAATMTIGTHTGGSDLVGRVDFLPGFVDLVRNRPFIEQFSNSASTSSPTIKWTEKVNAEGNAEFIGEGELKPLVDFEWKKNSSEAKKVADKIKVSTEMLEDIDFMAAAIESELRYLVEIKADEQLLSGDGTGDNLKGITEYAGAYTLTGISTTTANNSDAIRAAGAQIASLNFMANYAFVNPIDFANMDLQKSSTGEYVLPPFSTADGRQIAGIRVVESNQIPVGYVLVGDMTRFMIRNYKPFTVNYGWVNDDFEKNLVTVIGEKRLHDFVADNNTGAFVYDTFDNIKTAITIP